MDAAALTCIGYLSGKLTMMSTSFRSKGFRGKCTKNNISSED